MKKTRIILYFICLLICLGIVSGCSNNNTGKVKEEKKKSSKPIKEKAAEIKLKDGVLDRNPKNLRIASDGSNVFFVGARGIYNVTSDDWQMVYQGENIKGIDVYQNKIYLLQSDESATKSSIIRLDYTGENVETVLDDSGLSAWLRIYEDVLYSYENGTYLIKGFELDKEGNIINTLDNKDPQFLFALENGALEAVSNPPVHTIQPGVSREYYGGIFETRKIESSSEILSQEVVFISDGSEETIIPTFKDSVFIVLDKVCYTKSAEDSLMNTNVYLMDLKQRVESTLYTGSATFINYDKEHLYFTDEMLHPGMFQTVMIKRVNFDTGEVSELFPLEMGVQDYNECFDVLNGWVYYKDRGTGEFVRRNLDNVNVIQQEP